MASAPSLPRLQALLGRPHVSDDYVRFRIALLAAQTAVRDALARTASAAPPFDRALLTQLIEQLSAELPSEDLRRLAAAAAAEPDLLENPARRAAEDPDAAALAALAGRLQISGEALRFFGRALAAPFVAARPSAAPPEPGRCPRCGTPPGLAKLRREDGRRILFCSLCGEGWEFARAACPFCRGPDALGRLLGAKDDPRWIETCDACLGYLKTVDERKLDPDAVVSPLVEATATVHLDLMAEEQGYARGLPYVALR
ncbi:MAG: hypothetical protein ACYTFD_04205 [Planctomycetota bacterium]